MPIEKSGLTNPVESASERAKRRDALWNRFTVNDEFFREFGEPQSIRVQDEDNIVLSYPHGDKIISTNSAMNSKHWEVSPSNQWKETEESLKAKFTFPAIPEANVWRSVVSLSINPILGKEFDLLPQSAQEEILVKVKEKILPPEGVAEKYFDHFVNADYNKKKISQLRDDLRSLQAPGECFVGRSTRKQQLYEPLSPDERRGDTYYEGNVTTFSLTVGARKMEKSGWSNNYHGGKSFVISSGEHTGAPKKTTEQIREEIIVKKRRQLKNVFDQAKKINPPSSDARLYTLDTEEWIKRCETRWDEMQKAIETEWEIEDTQLLAETKQAWEQYENVAKDLQVAREEAEQAERLARVSRVDLKNHARPSWGNIGADTVEEIQAQAMALHLYASEINKYVPDAIKMRDQEFKNENAVREEEEKQRNAVREAEIEQFGASGTLLNTARSLATEATKKLGPKRARALFQETYGASYGRAGRQADIKDALGEDILENARSFYHFAKANDVNAVLHAVLRILEGADVSSEKPQHDKQSPELSEAELIPPQEVESKELPRLNPADNKGWWSHELPNGMRHSDKLSKTDKTAYDAGERINVHCQSCSGHPLVGYLQK